MQIGDKMTKNFNNILPQHQELIYNLFSKLENDKIVLLSPKEKKKYINELNRFIDYCQEAFL